MLEFYLAVFLMLAGAWLFGEVFHRLGLPALVGQLLAGVIIGQSVLNIVQPTSDLATLENVALFFIMLLTGLTVNPAKLVAAGVRGATVSCIAFAIPFVAGAAVSEAFGIGTASSLTIGLTVSITAVPVNSIVLMELGLLNTDLGATVIAAGVIDDIISFITLVLILQFSGNSAGSGDWDIAMSVAKIGLFLGAVFLIEHFVRHNIERVRGLTDRLEQRLRTPGSFFALLVASAIGISLLAEWSGLQLVIGSFFAGLVLGEVAGPGRLAEASSVVRGATFGFFGPLAFTFIGIEFVFGSVEAMPLLVSALLVVAVASKFFGGYAGGRLSRFTPKESTMIGFLMNSRGFVELVIAATAYQLGLIDQGLFSIVVCVGILTTIISPVATRKVLKRDDP